jgi:hypothetical protein
LERCNDGYISRANEQQEMFMRKVDLGNGVILVTFEFRAGLSTERVALCGDFNDWATDAHVLEPGRGRDRALSLALPLGRYEFRYLLDGRIWTNDPQADDHIRSPYGGLNSVVDLGGSEPAHLLTSHDPGRVRVGPLLQPSAA